MGRPLPRSGDALFAWLPLVSLGALVAIAAASGDGMAFALTAYAFVVYLIGKLSSQPSTSTQRLQAADAAVAMAQTNARLSEQQAANELFAHLAQRNQRLLDRQIGIIAALEDSERDPDRLADFFELDHIANQVRRNAESLQMLGGGAPARRWSGPVPLTDVVRAAVAETDDYRRVAIHVDEGLSIDGAAVAELVHVLAELIENAVAAAGDGAPVTVRSRVDGTSDRTYTVTIEDQGLGLDPRQLAEANEVLHDSTTTRLGELLGLQVVSRLAARRGVTVTLEKTVGGGVTANVELPASVFVDGTGARAGSRLDVDMLGPAAVAPLRALPHPAIAPEDEPLLTAAAAAEPRPESAFREPPLREVPLPEPPFPEPIVAKEVTIDTSPIPPPTRQEAPAHPRLEPRQAPVQPVLRRRTPGASLDAVAAETAAVSSVEGASAKGGARPGLFDFDPRKLSKFQAAQNAARQGVPHVNGQSNGGAQ